jgi:hypothetical protein
MSSWHSPFLKCGCLLKGTLYENSIILNAALGKGVDMFNAMLMLSPSKALFCLGGVLPVSQTFPETFAACPLKDSVRARPPQHRQPRRIPTRIAQPDAL